MMRFLLNLFIFFCVVFSNAQETLSPQQAVETALENNYQIRIASNIVEMTKTHNEWGNTNALPNVEGVFNYNKTDMNTTLTQMDGTEREIPNNKGMNMNYGINLGWTIFDGMGMFAQKKQLDELQKQGETQLQLIVLNRVADVLSTYYMIVQQQQLLQAIDTAIVISQERYELANNRYKIGKASKLEVLNAQVDLNTDKTNYLTQKQQYENIKIFLNELLAREVNTPFVVEKQVELDEKLLFEDLMLLAKEQNPDLQLALIEKKIAEFELKKVKANRLPKIDLRGGYNITDSESSFGFTTASNSKGWNYGLGATLNIFDGFSQNRNERIAKLQLENSDITIKEREQSINSRLATTYQTYITNLELVKLEENNEEIAKENLDITLEKFRIGRITTVEFRAAQLNYIQAITRSSIAKFQAKLSEISLKELTGSLTF
ncbi:MAG: TolC family protein [Flavobacteriaceae bacterium]